MSTHLVEGRCVTSEGKQSDPSLPSRNSLLQVFIFENKPKGASDKMRFEMSCINSARQKVVTVEHLYL